MYHVAIELQKHEWKFEWTRNDVRTGAAGECFNIFFEFSQTFSSENYRNQIIDIALFVHFAWEWCHDDAETSAFNVNIRLFML